MKKARIYDFLVTKMLVALFAALLDELTKWINKLAEKFLRNHQPTPTLKVLI